MKQSYKGIFKPNNPHKYAGDANRIVYRSMLERRFMVYCDKNEEIVTWASEELPILYRSPFDGRVHRYFPDFIIKTKVGKKYIIEIKPYRQCYPPKPPKKKSRSYLNEQLEYIKNQAKWQAAKIYCEGNDFEFKIFTEKELGIYN